MALVAVWYVPMVQTLSIALPVPGQAWPVVHGSQLDWPVLIWNVPAAHGVAAVSVGPGQEEPAGQSVQAAAPAPLYVPAPQSISVVVVQ